MQKSEEVNMESSDKRLLNAKEAAAILDMTPASLRYLSRAGYISYIRHGKRQMRWTKDQLEEYLKRTTVEADREIREGS